jgi:hypothetical protein
MNDKRFDPQPEAFVTKPKKVLKLGNEKSKLKEIMAARPQTTSFPEFEKKADDAVKAHSQKNDTTVNKATELINSLRDKTLVTEKGAHVLEYEKNLRKEFVNLVTELNNPPIDDLETQEGLGASTATSLILKMLFEFRDRINELEFKLEQK